MAIDNWAQNGSIKNCGFENIILAVPFSSTFHSFQSFIGESGGHNDYRRNSKKRDGYQKTTKKLHWPGRPDSWAKN